jgi:3-dehydroquinate dehydratase-2
MEKTQNSRKVLVIHGPNLNMLGTREPEIYGKATLDEIDQMLENLGDRLSLAVESFQSNYEGGIVEKIQESASDRDGLVINPGAYTHTSIAIRDALLMLEIPVIEVHLSNIYRREPFRHTSLIADVVFGRICGFGVHGYSMALDALAHILSK